MIVLPLKSSTACRWNCIIFIYLHICLLISEIKTYLPLYPINFVCRKCRWETLYILPYEVKYDSIYLDVLWVFGKQSSYVILVLQLKVYLYRVFTSSCSISVLHRFNTAHSVGHIMKYIIFVCTDLIPTKAHLPHLIINQHLICLGKSTNLLSFLVD